MLSIVKIITKYSILPTKNEEKISNSFMLKPTLLISSQQGIFSKIAANNLIMSNKTKI